VTPSAHDLLPPRRRRPLLRAFFDRLSSAYGPQHWWPARTPLEVVVGAILTQNTAWRNVERAFAALERADALDWRVLDAMPTETLAGLIRPAGTYRVKALRLKAFTEALLRDHGGSLERMLSGDLDESRERLRAIHGIGPETADAILLYAGGRPTFVVDAYTRRILHRHYLISPDTTYEDIRAMFHDALDADAAVFNEYHALLVRLGKEHCRSRAVCAGCPLDRWAHRED
jgi:endonuclease-3 related protein